MDEFQVTKLKGCSTHKKDQSCLHTNVKEPEYEDYKDKIKKKCVSCLTTLSGTWSHFLSHGNFCSKCTIRADNILKIKLVVGTLEKQIEEMKNKNMPIILVKKYGKDEEHKRYEYYIEVSLENLKEQLKESKLSLKEKIGECRQYYDGKILFGQINE